MKVYLYVEDYDTDTGEFIDYLQTKLRIQYAVNNRYIIDIMTEEYESVTDLKGREWHHSLAVF